MTPRLKTKRSPFRVAQTSTSYSWPNFEEFGEFVDLRTPLGGLGDWRFSADNAYGTGPVVHAERGYGDDTLAFEIQGTDAEIQEYVAFLITDGRYPVSVIERAKYLHNRLLG